MSNSYRVRVPAFILLLLIGSLSAISAEEPDRLHEDPLPPLDFATAPWDDEHNLSKERIPLSVLVRGMFPQIALRLRNDEFRAQKLRDSFGIKEGSQEEAALLRAVLAAAEVEADEAELARRGDTAATRLAALGEEAYMRAYREASREEARALGVVWGQFVADLGGSESRSMVKIRDYLEGRRAGISIASTESLSDPDHWLWLTERAFQEGVTSVSSSTPRK